jgi:transcriptional regulator with XRE-family HTH domain
MAQPMTSTSFADLLRQSRLAAGLTQVALAERARLGVRAIQYLEAGRGQPQRETARRLVDALGLHGEQSAIFEAAATPSPRARRRHVHQYQPPESQDDVEPAATAFSADDEQGPGRAAYSSVGKPTIRQRLRKAGNSYVVTIPKSDVERLHLREGQILTIEIRPLDSRTAPMRGGRIGPTVADLETWRRARVGQ